MGRLDNEARRRVLEYVLSRGVKPRDLGFDSTYVYKARTGRSRVSDELVRACLRFITPEELARLTGIRLEEANATPTDAIRVIRTMQVDPAYRDFVFSLLRQAFGEYLREAGAEWVVTEEDINAFVRAKKLRGVREQTLNDELRYIRRALAELGFRLTPDGIREYLAGLAEESPYVLKHTTYSLKSLLKEVLKPKNPWLFSMLYNSFTTVKPKPNHRVRLPTIEELRRIWQEILSVEARLYFTILAETGLRPSEPFLISIDDVDLDKGVMHIGKVTETKRAFIAFLRPEVIDWVKTNYMPVRESLVKAKLDIVKADYLEVKPNPEDWARKFIPFDRDRLRREIKDAARKVLNREFELYELRKFFATWMVSQGVPESIVNTLQGRAPPQEFRVLIEHYWSPRHEELRGWYLKYAPKICCLG
ncbi:MAG: tyrosine-type recombinase/integrase [Vulcanisaeta sp.]|uniref:tyrosine-type recombinase/integrase n=1 Tax=Vulcanisaeta sp. TaxID=2020871 RepID=UPI003D145974